MKVNHKRFSGHWDDWDKERAAGSASRYARRTTPPSLFRVLSPQAGTAVGTNLVTVHLCVLVTHCLSLTCLVGPVGSNPIAPTISTNQHTPVCGAFLERGHTVARFLGDDSLRHAATENGSLRTQFGNVFGNTFFVHAHHAQTHRERRTFLPPRLCGALADMPARDALNHT